MPDALRESLSQTWPPFVLVTGLLLLGRAAADDGLFALLGDRLGRTRGRPVTVLVVALGLVAVTTALLNLDTAVVFLTPVLVLAARRRGLDEAPFLYGSLFMANAASLPLPGSNLTNLLVLHVEDVSGGRYVGRLAPAAAAAILVTGAGIVLAHRRALRAPGPRAVPGRGRAAPGLRGRESVAAAGLAAVAIVVVGDPALPVLGLGLAITALHVTRGRAGWAEVVRAASPAVTLGLFLVAVALGWLARSWSGPADLVAGASPVATAVLGALGAVTVNNLPAAVLLSSAPPPHPRALLIGLDLGPNLAVTGSLSSYLWWRAARSVGARPRVGRVTRLGLVLAPAAIAAALAATALLTSSGGL